MEIKPAFSGRMLPAHYQSETLSENQLLECQGGKVPVSVWWAVASVIISNWQDIREGFSDGVSGKPARY